jgi:hypothetical protein
VPENKVVEIGILSEDMITSPEFKLGEIKTLISKTTNSKLGLDKIFGRRPLTQASTRSPRSAAGTCASR